MKIPEKLRLLWFWTDPATQWVVLHLIQKWYKKGVYTPPIRLLHLKRKCFCSCSSNHSCSNCPTFEAVFLICKKVEHCACICHSSVPISALIVSANNILDAAPSSLNGREINGLIDRDSTRSYIHLRMVEHYLLKV